MKIKFYLLFYLLLFLTFNYIGLSIAKAEKKNVTVLFSQYVHFTLPIDILSYSEEYFKKYRDELGIEIISAKEVSLINNDSYYLYDVPSDFFRTFLPKKRKKLESQLSYSDFSINVIETWDSLILIYPDPVNELTDAFYNLLKDHHEFNVIKKIRGVPFTLQAEARDVLSGFKIERGFPEFDWKNGLAFIYRIKVKGVEKKVILFSKIFGGMKKLETAIANVKKEVRDENLLILDGGSSVITKKGEDRVGEFKKMGYELTIPDWRDLVYGWDVINKYHNEGFFKFVAVNIFDPKEEKYIFDPYTIVERNGIKIGIIGVPDPIILTEYKKPHFKDFTMIPLKKKELYSIVKELKKKVDIIILITNAEEKYDGLLKQNSGIDIILGNYGKPIADGSSYTIDLEQKKINLMHPTYIAYNARSRALSRLDLNFFKSGEKNKLTRIKHNMIPLDETVISSNDLTDEWRTKFFYERDILLPTAKDVFADQTSYKNSQFFNLCSKIVREVTDAEVSLIRKYYFTYFAGMPGEIPLYYIDDWLRRGDRIRILYLSGRDLISLIKEVKSAYLLSDPIQGVFAGIENDFVNGEAISEKEVYRLAVSHYFLEKSNIFPSLKNGLNISSKFRSKNGKFKEVKDGRWFTIHDIVTDYLKRLQKDMETRKLLLVSEKLSPKFAEIYQKEKLVAKRFDEDFKSIKLDIDREVYDVYCNKIRDLIVKKAPIVVKKVPPKFSLFKIKINEMAFNLVSTQIYNNEDLTDVRNSRVTATDQLVIGGEGDFEAVWSYMNWRYMVGTELKYSKVTLYPEGEEKVESDAKDDLVGKTEVSYNLVTGGVPVLASKLGPSLYLAYDGEFTPTAGNPREQLFQIAPGIKLYDGKYLSNLFLAEITEVDFSTGDTNTEFGILTKAELDLPIYKNVVSLDFDLDFVYFFPSGSDTSDDLEIELENKTTLEITVFRNLTVGPFVDLLFFRGKLNNQNGVNFMVGIEVDYSKIWKPFYERLF